MSPNVVVNVLVHALRLYKSRGSEGCFFTFALLLESTLLLYSTPKVFGEGAT